MSGINVNKLKGKMVENGLSIATLAKKIGMDRATLYRKINNNAESMLIKDANAIISALNLSAEDAMSIFFSQFVA